MFGIIGSGFGLYGYLPAICLSYNENIFLIERYKEKFNQRKELRDFADRINWVKDIDDVIRSTETIILSVAPDQQFEIIKEKVLASGVKNVLLEKPIAVSPRLSIELLEKIQNTHKTYRIGYNLAYTEWAKQLISLLGTHTDIERIEIEWSFLAHHYRFDVNTWKRDTEKGGGVLRFYGIHFIALAALLNYTGIEFSQTFGFTQNDLFRWNSIISNEKSSYLKINIDSNSSQPRFKIMAFLKNRIDPVFQFVQADPFTNKPPEKDKLDERISTLQSLLSSLFRHDLNQESYELYHKTNQLWLSIEKNNILNINHNALRSNI